MIVKVKKLNLNAKIIQKGTPGSAGWDLYYVGPNRHILPGEIQLLPTGLAFALEEGAEAQIRSRSGLSLKGIIVLNSPGTIDSDYRGEIKVILFNASKETFTINSEQAIAQVVFARVPKVEILSVEELSTDTKRGKEGFGSTDLKT